MAMAQRKLMQEIERTLKKVEEGVEQFEETWEKVNDADHANLKEKYESDLKKEIKKLQRFREQIKTWAASNDVKKKKPLLEARKLIETKMEMFKVLEREMKTKAYSKEGLSKVPQKKKDPRADPRYPYYQWCEETAEALQEQIDELQERVDEFKSGGKRKMRENASEVERLQHWVERHAWHQEKLRDVVERMKRKEVALSQVDELKESVDFYVSDNQTPDFYDDEFMYDVLEEVEPGHGDGDSDSDDDGGDGDDDAASASALAAAAAAREEEEKKAAAEAEERRKKEEKKRKDEAAAAKKRDEASKKSKKEAKKDKAKKAAAAAAAAATAAAAKDAPGQGRRKSGETLANILKKGPAPGQPQQGQQQQQPQQGQPQQQPPQQAAPQQQPRRQPQSFAGQPQHPQAQPMRPPHAQQQQQQQQARPVTVPDLARNLRMLAPSLANMPSPQDTEHPKQYVPRNPMMTPSFFPSAPARVLDDPAVFSRFSGDSLFFVFYFNQGTQHQYYAARELKRQSWRYHKNFLTWFQRHDDPKRTTEEFEQGAYIYFDYESGWCQRVKQNFTFRYCHLEDELQVNP